MRQLITSQNVLTAGVTGLALTKTVSVATILESLISTFTFAETALVGLNTDLFPRDSYFILL